MTRTAQALLPPERVTVAEAARRHRVLDNKGGGYRGPWTFDLAPHLLRPHEALSDPAYRMVAIMGGGQCGKSELANNWLLQTVIYDQGNMIWLQVDKDMMADYVATRIDPMIELCKELKARLIGNKAFLKTFIGSWVRFIWPVPGQMRSRPAPKVVVDDFDDVPEDIGGQGDSLSLLGARQTTFEGSEKTLVMSSPARGPKAGIEAVVGTGTNESRWWPCPSCGEYFLPDFDRDLRFDKDSTPDQAERSTVMVCPSNGCVIEPRHKSAMMPAAKWCSPGQRVTPDGQVVGARPDTDIASFRFYGLFGFLSWGRLAKLHREAELKFELSQDEGPLRAFYNARLGVNYRPRLEGARPLEAAELEDRLDDYQLGEVPPGVEVLIAAVDVQGDRFEVMVLGFGAGAEAWLIDRFAVAQLEDGRSKVDPAKYPEHWQALLQRVIWRRYPLAAAPELMMPVLATSIDRGGLPGVAEAATKFWYTARRAGVPDRALTMVKGGNNPKARLLPPPSPLELDRQGRPKKTGPKVFVPNVNALKDILAVRLRRTEPGPGCLHFPADLDAAYFDELTAEEKDEKGLWHKTKPRNETADLYLYCEVSRLRLAGERVDLDWIPAWARRPARALEARPAEAREESPAAARPTAPEIPSSHPLAKAGRRRGRRGGVRA
jgi:phage terminase large subunit GpA-like protein